MSVSLVQGDIFHKAITSGFGTPAQRKTQNDGTDDLISDFNNAVTAYSTAHQQYVSALLSGTATKQKLEELEQTATLKYQNVISAGSKVTSRTKDLVSQENNANYGAQIREVEHQLSSVLATLADEQTKIAANGGSTLDAAIKNAKLRATAEQTRTALWMIAMILVLILITSYLL